MIKPSKIDNLVDKLEKRQQNFYQGEYLRGRLESLYMTLKHTESLIQSLEGKLQSLDAKEPWQEYLKAKSDLDKTKFYIDR